MTLEDKKLLFKDLCARVPYGVKVKWADGVFKFDEAHQGIGALYKKNKDGSLSEEFDIVMSGCYYGEVIMPYLRPMSSMTEEEQHEYDNLRLDNLALPKVHLYYPMRWHTMDYLHVDWLNAHHFDYRGLIEKGLALEAEEGMYND